MKPTPQFKLYPQEQRWWGFGDHAHVMAVMERLKPKRVLEFGPGSSSLALIEGGAVEIDCVEDQPDWAEVWEQRLAGRFPEPGWPTVVRVHRYYWAPNDALSIPAVDGQHFDMALIDGPRGTERRPDVLRYCLARCDYVLMPAEEWQTRAWLRPIITEIAAEAGRPVEFVTTGALSGAFALVGPATAVRSLPPRLAPAPAAQHIPAPVQAKAEQPKPKGKSKKGAKAK